MNKNKKSNISAQTGSARSRHIVRISLCLLGSLVALYAVSDHPLYGGAPGFGNTQALLLIGGVALIVSGFLQARLADPILVLSVVGLIMLGVSELAAEKILGPRFRTVYELDDQLIFRMIPDRTSVMTRAPLNGGETIAHQINSSGFRGPELRTDNESRRVVVYGDSFIHAYYSPWEETFAGQLDTLLDERLGEDIEVVNAGVSSYGPDQIALKMEAELPLLRPDLVIVSVFAGNDFGDLLRNKLFLLDEHGRLAPNPDWHVEPELIAQWEISQQTSILKRAAGEAATTVRRLIASETPADADDTVSDFINLTFLSEQAEREFSDYVLNSNPVVTNTHIDYYSANINLSPDSPSVHYQSRLMQQVLHKISLTAANANVPLVFMFIPHPFDVAEDYDEWHLDWERFPNYDARNQVRILEDAARGINAQYLSLYEPFRENDANKLYFHGGDDHWNAAGQLLAAKLMTRQLIQLKIFSSQLSHTGSF